MYSIFRIHWARLRPIPHHVLDFSHICLSCRPCRIMYSIFRIHSPRLLPMPHHILDFSHTFGSIAAYAASYTRFFAYFWLGYCLRRTIYSIFRIHSPRVPPMSHYILDFSHTLCSGTVHAAPCTRFFAYIRLGCRPRRTIYSIFRILLARLLPASAPCTRFFAYIVLGYGPTRKKQKKIRVAADHWRFNVILEK